MQRTYDGPSPEEVLVDDLIQLMEKGETPWRKEWEARTSRHVNLFSNHFYSGSNIILLEMGMAMRGASMPYWCGAAEARKYKIFPKKGSKSVRIIRPQLNKREEENEQGETQERSWVSYKIVPVFNVCDLQGDGLEQFTQDCKVRNGWDNCIISDEQRIEKAEVALNEWPVEIHHGGPKACYMPSEDKIILPAFGSFETPEAYYSTRAHECIHSTGHQKRLNRDLSGNFGSKSYAVEELVAELGAVLLCNQLEISSNFNNHAAYLQSWVKVLKEEPRILFKCLTAAKKAAELVLGKVEAEQKQPVVA